VNFLDAIANLISACYHLYVLGEQEARRFIESALSQTKDYQEIFIPKKDGGERKVLIPQNDLKQLQGIVINWLKSIWPNYNGFMLYGFGHTSADFEKGSHVDYARWHSGSNWFWQADIKDAFPSANIKKLKKTIYRQFMRGVCLFQEKRHGEKNKATQFPFPVLFLEDSPEISILADPQEIGALAELIIKITTFDGILPQGAPSSPFLFCISLLEDPNEPEIWLSNYRLPNGVWSRVLQKIHRETKGLIISGYIDNICISCSTPYYPLRYFGTPQKMHGIPSWVKNMVIDEFAKSEFTLHKIVETDFRQGSPNLCGLHIAETPPYRRQIVLPKKEIHQIRGLIYNWSKTTNPQEARKILGLINSMRMVYGSSFGDSFDTFPPQIKNLIDKIGFQNIVKAASL